MLGLGGIGLVLALVLVAGGVTWAAVKFSAGVQTAGNTFRSGTMQLESAVGAATCYSTGSGSGGSVTTANTAQCTGSPIPTGTLSSTASSSATTTLTSKGNVNATSAVVATPSCGVAQLADSVAATDWSGTGPNTALPFNGVTYQATGPLSTQAITTDGSTGSAETTTEYTNPESFTILVWFKTSTAQGAIAGFSNSQNSVATAPSNYDRELWIGASGKLNWGVYDGAVDVLTSTSTVDTGAWDFAAATVGSSGTTLYVNGTQVAHSAGVTAAQSYSGWWSMGYADVANWTDIPSSYYFKGSIAQMAIIPSQLTQAQVTTLKNDSTLSAYTAGVNALNPASYWALNDPGTAAYTGAIPGLTTPAQNFADVSVNNNTGTGGTGVTPDQAGYYSGQGSTALNGTAQVTTTTDYTDNPTTFTLAAWFQTSSTQGGSILGFASGTTNGSVANAGSTRPEMLWLDNAGQVVFGVYTTTFDALVSPLDYNNGAWHFVVASMGSNGMQLYVDGALVNSSANATAQLSAGWWHVGWSGENASGSWPDEGTNAYWNGDLADVTVISSQLTAAQVTSLYTAANGTVFSTSMLAQNPTSFWPLDDTVTSPACAEVMVSLQTTIGSTVSCAYPVGTGACPALSASALLSGFALNSIAVPVSGSAVTVAISMELTAAAPTGTAGLILLLPGLSFATARPQWSAQVNYTAPSVLL